MDNYTFLKTNQNLQIPIMLESYIDDMGVMVEFDKLITEVDNIFNFSYIIKNNVLKLYITGKYKVLINNIIKINWGDGVIVDFEINNSTINNAIIEHKYNDGIYNLSITLSTPWNNSIITKQITIPNNFQTTNILGTISGITIPYTDIENVEQNYLFNENVLNNEVISYMVLTNSRINELKLYGENNFSNVTIVDNVSGYTIDNISYKDFPDGLTIMEISNVGFTREEIIENAITRNENFIGFIDTPQVFSDVFIERGKTSITENNFKLTEINDINKLTDYFMIEKI